MEKEKTIYDLELHERLDIDYLISVLRVDGGWIYENVGINTTTFAPISFEFRNQAQRA